jgi:hypothetical protein
MDANAQRYPDFQETGFCKSWMESLIAFPNQTQEQQDQGLRLAYEIYQRCKERWEADQRKSRDDGIGLVS